MKKSSPVFRSRNDAPFVIIHEKCSREDEAAIDLILCFSFRVKLIIAMHWEYIHIFLGNHAMYSMQYNDQKQIFAQ